jgi:short-subunit dehydrogenase
MQYRFSRVGGAMLVGAAAVMMARAARRSAASFAGKTVVITGGSRGLGFALAQRLASEGANLALLARSEDQLRAAALRLESEGAAVETIVCDIRNRAAVDEAVETIVRRFGRIDVLINNAGVIQITPFVHAQHSDYEDSLNTHFWASLFMIEACLPYMVRQRSGQIVNISSIGGRIGVPHLIPYTVGKFALAGFSDALRAELKPMGIAVTTVTPYLMRTGSHRNALVRGQHEKEAAWFALGSSRLISISAERAARKIVEAVRRRRARVAPGWPTRAAEVMQALAPELTAGTVATVARLALPEPSRADIGDTGLPSRDLDLGSVARFLPTDAAAELNQHLAPDEVRALKL